MRFNVKLSDWPRSTRRLRNETGARTEMPRPVHWSTLFGNSSEWQALQRCVVTCLPSWQIVMCTVGLSAPQRLQANRRADCRQNSWIILLALSRCSLAAQILKLWSVGSRRHPSGKSPGSLIEQSISADRNESMTRSASDRCRKLATGVMSVLMPNVNLEARRASASPPRFGWPISSFLISLAADEVDTRPCSDP